MTPSELERLAILAEECSKVIQIVNKIIRHSWESYHPNDKEQTSNRNLLEKEIYDLLAVISAMANNQDVNMDLISDYKNIDKIWEQKLRWTYYQQKLPATITIYGKPGCSWCTKAIDLARDNGFITEYLDVTEEANLRELKERMPEAATVPQIWIDEKYIGGYQELFRMLME